MKSADTISIPTLFDNENLFYCFSWIYSLGVPRAVFLIEAIRLSSGIATR